MALRNAFAAVATEATLDRLAGALEAINRWMIDRDRHDKAFARDAADRLRVSVDNTQTVSTASSVPITVVLRMGVGNDVYPLWFASGSPNSMDAREIQKLQAATYFQQTRQRWVFS